VLQQLAAAAPIVNEAFPPAGPRPPRLHRRTIRGALRGLRRIPQRPGWRPVVRSARHDGPPLSLLRPFGDLSHKDHRPPAVDSASAGVEEKVKLALAALCPMGGLPVCLAATKTTPLIGPRPVTSTRTQHHRGSTRLSAMHRPRGYANHPFLSDGIRGVSTVFIAFQYAKFAAHSPPVHFKEIQRRDKSGFRDTFSTFCNPGARGRSSGSRTRRSGC